MAESLWDEAKRVRISDAATMLGLDLKRARTQRCPFPSHRDANPSFSYDPDKDLFQCFGCGARGTSIDFVATFLNCSPKIAAEWLTTGRSRLPEGRKSERHRIEPAREDYAGDPDVYERLLSMSPLTRTAVAYLESRAITETTANKFRVGYIEDANLLLDDMSGVFGVARIRRAGLVGAGSKLVFRSCSLLFPYAQAGRPTYLQARHLGTAAPRWMGLRGIAKQIYNVEALSDVGPIYICEGAMDVLSAHELGLNAIGLPGALTRVGAPLRRRLKGRLVYIVPDRDQAGAKMASQLVRDLRRDAIQSVVLPIAEADLNEHLRRRRGLL